eukprot:7243753-Ditylum_brightwellii.AAC.1
MDKKFDGRRRGATMLLLMMMMICYSFFLFGDGGRGSGGGCATVGVCVAAIRAITIASALLWDICCSIKGKGIQ